VIRRTAGTAALVSLAAAAIAVSLAVSGGRSEGTTVASDHASAWTPPPPSEVPLDCIGGMTFAPAPVVDAHRLVAAGAGAAAGPTPVHPASSPTPGGLAEVMTAEARAGFPDLVAGLLRYEVADVSGTEATIVGSVAGRRLVLAPAVQRSDGTWAWRDGRPVRNPNGAWVTQGTMVACDETFERL
jgi:hypothetical protein